MVFLDMPEDCLPVGQPLTPKHSNDYHSHYGGELPSCQLAHRQDLKLPAHAMLEFEPDTKPMWMPTQCNHLLPEGGLRFEPLCDAAVVVQVAQVRPSKRKWLWEEEDAEAMPAMKRAPHRTSIRPSVTARMVQPQPESSTNSASHLADRRKCLSAHRQLPRDLPRVLRSSPRRLAAAAAQTRQLAASHHIHLPSIPVPLSRFCLFDHLFSGTVELISVSFLLLCSCFQKLVLL